MFALSVTPLMLPLMLLVPALALFALFYGLVLVNNIVGGRFERSLHSRLLS